MAMWLPECSEKHVAQLAAARVGMVVAEVDPKLASAGDVGKILEESGAAVRCQSPSPPPSESKAYVIVLLVVKFVVPFVCRQRSMSTDVL